MKNLRFRAWDKERGKMLYVLHLDLLNNGVCCKCPYEELEGDSNPYLEDVPVMQYTGLVDKNGAGIYEGDILRHTSFIKDCAVITFRDGAFHCGLVPINTYHNSVIEVIGNIYENPELLEDVR
jgi:uncharacterized phage protein (TIGR01671 family)